MGYRALCRLSVALLSLLFLFRPGLGFAEPVRICVGEFLGTNAETRDWIGRVIADSLAGNLKVHPDMRVLMAGQEGGAGECLPDGESDCARASYGIGGEFREEGEKLFVTVSFVKTEDGEAIGGASILCSLDDLHVNLDDLAVSLATSLGINFSEEDITRLSAIPTDSVSAMALYGRALAFSPTSDEYGALLREALSIDPEYTDALSKLGIHYFKTGKLARASETLERLAGAAPGYPHVHYNLGLAYGARRLYSKAIDMYHEALRIEPNDSDAWNNLGITLYYTGMNEEALEAFKRAVEVNPHDTIAQANLRIIQAKHHSGAGQPHSTQSTGKLKEYIESGATLYASGQYWSAIEQFKRALELQPNNFKANNNIALAYAKIGETEEARKHFKNALKVDPTALDVSENLARLDAAFLPPDAPFEGASVSVTDGSARALRATGDIYIARREYHQAAEAYQRALAISPGDTDAMIGLGAAYFALGDYQSAGEQFQQALTCEPENELAQKKLEDVRFVLAAGEHEAGVPKAYSINVSSQTEARARFIEANQLFEAGKYPEALAEYLRALDLEPTSVEILNNLGNTYYRLGRYDEAKTVLSKASQLDPENEMVRGNLEALVMTEDAQRTGEMKALEVTAGDMSGGDGASTTEFTGGPVFSPPLERTPSVPKEPDSGSRDAQSALAHFDMGFMKEEEGDLEGALQHYREVVRQEPGNAIACYNLGNIYLHLGALQSAIESYSAAIEADSEFANSHNNMGVAYYRLGRVAEATDAWRRALAIDPTLESARQNLQNFDINQ